MRDLIAGLFLVLGGIFVLWGTQPHMSEVQQKKAKRWIFMSLFCSALVIVL